MVKVPIVAMLFAACIALPAPARSQVSVNVNIGQPPPVVVEISTRYTPKAKQVDAQAVSPDYFTIKRMKPERGRLFTEQEYDNGTPVVVIGQDVKDHFFPGVDPIDRELKVAGIPYTVVFMKFWALGLTIMARTQGSLN